MKKIRRLFNKYSEIIGYLFFGVLTTVVSWGSYSLFVLLFNGTALRGTYAVVLANILSWLFAVIFSFVTNKAFVFKSGSWKIGSIFPEACKFLFARLGTGLLEIVAVPLLVTIGLDQSFLGIDGMVSKILVSIVVVILNYFFCKWFIF